MSRIVTQNEIDDAKAHHINLVNTRVLRRVQFAPAVEQIEFALGLNVSEFIFSKLYLGLNRLDLAAHICLDCEWLGASISSIGFT